MEWSERAKFNSFNSFKGLAYHEHYQQIRKWMEGDNYLPPPIECNLDPYAACNLNCYFCVGQRYIRYNREEVSMRKLPTQYMLGLVNFLSRWGVKGLCISGGGEPSLHNGIGKVIDRGIIKGMDVCFVTNATRIIPETLQCRWVALSVDAGDWQTYLKVKGANLFDQVIANISKLSDERERRNSKVKLCYKYLVLPENQEGIFTSCQLAKNIGVQDFHVRPVDYERKDIKGHRKLEINVGKVSEQFQRCHEIEDDNFHVYTVTHKFDSDFHVKHDFTRCIAAPLVIPILTDGNVYLCVDKKMEAQYKLGSCYPEPEKILTWWGNEKHRNLVKSVDINHCSRCTWSQYNRQIDEIDNMDLAFP